MNKNLELYPNEKSNPSHGSESSKAFGQYITDLVEQISLFDIKGTIQHLTDYSTRFTFSVKAAEARQWIHEQFITMGYSDVVYQDFILCDSLQKNIVCSKEGRGKSDKILILCAHYDSIAKSTTGWDWQTCPAPGANDNASGVAAMLEIARILKNIDMNYTIRFIAFTGEEQNLWGSRAYADYALTNKMNIVLVINPFNSAGYAVIGVCQAGKYPHSHKVTDIFANIDIDYVVEATRMTLATILLVAGMQETFNLRTYCLEK